MAVKAHVVQVKGSFKLGEALKKASKNVKAVIPKSTKADGAKKKTAANKGEPVAAADTAVPAADKPKPAARKAAKPTPSKAAAKPKKAKAATPKTAKAKVTKPMAVKAPKAKTTKPKAVKAPKAKANKAKGPQGKNCQVKLPYSRLVTSTDPKMVFLNTTTPGSYMQRYRLWADLKHAASCG
eukprot:jgi/Chrzof1/12817/Cz07g08170.t1